MNKKLISAAGLGVLVVFFIVLGVVLNHLPSLRLDLTENKLYTLSEGSQNIVRGLEEPLKLYLFYSEQATRNFPTLRNYAQRVSELCDAFVRESNGKLALERIDPEPFSESEDKASEFGLQSIPVDESGSHVYFGLVGTNAVGETEIIPFFQPDKETFLEYEISKLIYKLSKPQKKVLGILSSIPLQGGYDELTHQPTSPLFVMEQLKTLFHIKGLSSPLKSIDPEIGVLMLVHPRDLPAETLYAIDQYVLKGGKLIVFVDPLAENSRSSLNRFVFEPAAHKASSLETLLKAWGVRWVPEDVLADKLNALTVRTSFEGRPVRHLAVLSLRGEYLNREDRITHGLSNVHVQSVGALEKIEGSTVDFTPLLESSSEAGLLKAEKVDTAASDPGRLLDGFEPTHQVYTIAARIHGKVRSAFPEGPPSPEKKKPSDPKQIVEDTTTVVESKEPVNIIVVADTDLLADHLWVRLQNFFGYQIPTFMANNGDFVVNAIDNLSGSDDLISIRSRGTYARPFEKVLVLQVVAEEKFRAKEQELQNKLKATEQKLSELQKNREASASLTLSEEQKQALLTFKAEKVKIRKALRDVQHELNKDIERLGTVLKFVNMGVMPISVILLAFVMRLLRAKHLRKKEYE